MKYKLGISSIVIVAITLVLTQITIFCIQPIGMVPEGKTLIILRLNRGQLIDSADAMCDREMGGVSLLCRMVALGAVASKSKILLRLPYSEFLYRISVDGKNVEK